MENAVLTWQHQVDTALSADPDAVLRVVRSPHHSPPALLLALPAVYLAMQSLPLPQLVLSMLFCRSIAAAFDAITQDALTAHK